MFVKQFYNSVRFYEAFISQFFVPIVFVLLAMILAKTSPTIENTSDPKRRLDLDNTAASNSRILFYAEFDTSADATDISVSIIVDKVGVNIKEHPYRFSVYCYTILKCRYLKSMTLYTGKKQEKCHFLFFQML